MPNFSSLAGLEVAEKFEWGVGWVGVVCTVIFMPNPTVVLCWGWGFDNINTVVPTDPRVDVPCEVQGDHGPLHQGYQDDHPSSGGEYTRHHRVQSPNLTVLDPRVPPSLPPLISHDRKKDIHYCIKYHVS